MVNLGNCKCTTTMTNHLPKKKLPKKEEEESRGKKGFMCCARLIGGMDCALKLFRIQPR